MRVTNAYESVYLFCPSAKHVPQTSSRMHFHHHPNKNAFSRWRLLSVMLIMMYSFRSSLLFYKTILWLEYGIGLDLSSKFQYSYDSVTNFPQICSGVSSKRSVWLAYFSISSLMYASSPVNFRLNLSLM